MVIVWQATATCSQPMCITSEQTLSETGSSIDMLTLNKALFNNNIFAVKLFQSNLKTIWVDMSIEDRGALFANILHVTLMHRNAYTSYISRYT